MKTSRSSPDRRGLLPLLLLCWIALVPTAAWGDAFDQHLDRGIALYQSRRYEEAIVAFNQAYALRQWPRLLFNIGQAHLRLGRAREALGYYERTLQLQPDAALREELERATAQARTLLVAVPPAAASPAGSPPPVAALRVAAEPPPLARVAPTPRPHRPPVWRRAWFWTTLGLCAGAAAAGVALGVTQPWRSPLWEGVPVDNRREVAF